ncbi:MULTISPECIES: capsule assembly Wzi family protein [Olivibacter]|uniref:Capsule assembly Wzi family protein n=1 Tax=Olivibacter jilunii TaxID=985016 RepID=A0ABW6B771_9SPHI|nr:capsule assembly Wzi family protein [Pseudosphingobacterium sp.]
MKRKKLIEIIVGILVLCASLPALGQVLPVGTPVLEDYYRRLQLLGKIDSTISFSVRPLTNEALQQENIYDPLIENAYQPAKIGWKNQHGFVHVMPVEWKNQFVSSFPTGWNDGPIIPAKGYQTYLSAGIQAQYKFLSIQLRPEFVYAQNSDFDGAWGEGYTGIPYSFYYSQGIDYPERFGRRSYSKIFPGQSFVKVNLFGLSLGISTENLWWGPGMRNSLLMSNTAPGFLHGTIGTNKPVRTGIGSFEGQLVSGRLAYSDFIRPDVIDPTDWRYFSGIIFSYQPKWIPGLSLGIINVFTVNKKDMGNRLGDYIPFFSSNSSSSSIDLNDPANASDAGAQDRNLSVFARWMVPSAHFEIYGEYARNDHGWDTRDLVVSANHSRSYLIGINKLVNLKTSSEDMLQIRGEVTQLEQPKISILRSTAPMYVHQVVRGGYTHEGQILGAGVGVGNNIQSLEISWVRRLKQLGIRLDRLVHDNDTFYRQIEDFRRNWVDLNITAVAAWDIKRLLLSSNLQFTKAFNYQYRLEERGGTGNNFWNFVHQDKSNLYWTLSALYRF